MSQVGNSYFMRVYASVRRTFQLSSTIVADETYPFGVLLRKFLTDSFVPYFDTYHSEHFDIHWLSSSENQQLTTLSDNPLKKTAQKEPDKEEDPIIPKKEFLRKYRCSYIVTDKKIYYVRPDLTLRPVTINNFPHFINALQSHNPNNKSHINLSFSQIHELVTPYGGNMHSKSESKADMREAFINGTAISKRYASTFHDVVGKQIYNPLNYLYVGSQLTRGILHTTIDQVTSLYYFTKSKLGFDGKKYPVIPIALKTVIAIGCMMPELVCYVAAHPVASLWQGMKTLYRKITGQQPSEEQNLIAVSASPRSQVVRLSAAATTMQKTTSNTSLSQLNTSSPSATRRSVMPDDAANTRRSIDQEKERIILQESLFSQKNLFSPRHPALRTLPKNTQKKSHDEKDDEILLRIHHEPEQDVSFRK